jgi:hypothetical protein
MVEQTKAGLCSDLKMQLPIAATKNKKKGNN